MLLKKFSSWELNEVFFLKSYIYLIFILLPNSWIIKFIWSITYPKLHAELFQIYIQTI